MNVQAAGNGNSMFVTNEEAVLRRQVEKAEKEQNGKRSSIYSGNLKLAMDPLTKRKKLAQEQAMKVVKDVFDADQKFDQTMQDSQSYIERLKQENHEYHKKLEAMPGRMAELQESYGIEADSQEQKDLELLQKGRDASQPWNQISLTEEEKERIAEIQKQGITDYQRDALALNSEKELYQTYIERNNLLIEATGDALASMKLEQLKEHPMVDAMGKMDEIMESVHKNTAFELMGEGVDHIQEEQEEKAEEAEKQAEKQEEQEEKIEAQEEKKEEKEEFIEETKENNEEKEDIVEAVQENTQDSIELAAKVKANDRSAKDMNMLMEESQDGGSIQKKLAKIMDKLKVLEEDLKGIGVDISL